MFTGRRRPAATVATVIFLVLAAAGTAAAENEDPGDFLIALSQRAIAELSDQSIGEAERQKRFRELLRANFEMRAIARFVLGAYARRADPEAQAAFLAAFEEVLIQRFLPYFRDYRGEAFTVKKVRPDPTNPKLSLVISDIILTDGKTLPVGWRVRRTKSGFKIFDVVAEGVSLAITFRSEYAAVLKRSGGDLPGLTAQLRAKLANGSFAPKTE
ncbi:MAG: ABC transporter substrate-binding protein [Kiloniellales bacterium]|nr:ABC transporter substrate-binding protein [Kiloniellales bacterium]